MQPNYGGVLERVELADSRDYILGSTSKLPTKVLQADRDWTPYKPTKENQKNILGDNYSCVTYSRNNCVETLEIKKWGKEFNRSDRFLSVASGTDPDYGNYFDRVAQAGRELGALEEKDYPFTPTMSLQEFYKKPIDPELSIKALKYKLGKTDSWEWVTWGGSDQKPDFKIKMWEALQYAPLQISFKAYGPYKDGRFYDAGDWQTNHAVTVLAGKWEDYWIIMDHYDNEIKKLDWSVYIGSVMRHNVELNMLKLIKGDKSPMVYAVGSNGEVSHIEGEATFRYGRYFGLWGGDSDIEVKPQAEVDALIKGYKIGFLIK
jgi:hypothetical protein